jgi:fatty acid desaturase
MNSLEDLSYDQVIHTRFGSYSSWRKQLKPVYAIVWRDIATGYVLIALILYLASLVKNVPFYVTGLTIFAGSVITGFLLAFLALFLHEAGHFNLHADKKINDRLATVFLGVLFGVSIKSYRKIHWQHHLHLGNTSDTETSYFNALTLTFFLETLTGIHLLKILVSKNKTPLLNQKMQKESWVMMLAGATFNIILIAIFIYLKLWFVGIIWILAMLVFFPFFASMRQLLEHRSETADKLNDYTKIPHGKLTRLFHSDLFSRFFGGAGFNKHMIHHWDAQVSYTRLGEVENYLSECEQTSEIIQSSGTTYFRTLRKLFQK